MFIARILSRLTVPILVSAGALVLGTAQPSGALYVITGSACPNVQINDNVRVAGYLSNPTNPDGSCISVTSGKDVDLDTYSITCSGGGCSGKVGILTAGTGTDVTGSFGHAAIIGGFGVGVKGAASVSNIYMNGPLVGISDVSDRAKSIVGNLIICSGTGYCVDVTMPRSTDEIIGNTISGSDGGLRIVGSSSGSGPNVASNNIGSLTGIAVRQVGATKNVQMLGNSLYDCTGEPGCTGGQSVFSVDNTSLPNDIDNWHGNECGDDYYCAPAASCSNGGDPICTSAGVWCTPVL